MKFASIASGSNGNCYYLENDEEAVLVDAGISAKQIVNRMANIGLSMSRVKGLFISHEHSDHIRGVDVLSRKFSLPVFLTRKTYASYGREISESLLNYFSPGEQVEIGGMRVSSFLKNHDAAEPCSFLVSSAGGNVAVMTDIGLECPNVVAHLRDADAIFLESNYDDDMLKHGPYPSFLKARIASDVGHLSNAQAAMIALQHASPRLQHIVLSHISENNNTPDLAFRTFDHVMKQRIDLNPELSVASRYRESGLVCLK